MHKHIKNKILVVGLGYVGLPLALNLADHYDVIGYDQSKKRVNDLRKKTDINKEIKKKVFNKKKIKFIFDKKKLPDDCNIFIITVPTPVDRFNKPDLQSLSSACSLISKKYKKNDIVIIESTIAPGTTENFCLNIICKNTKLKKSEINLCFSPERINPGDKENQLRNLTKVISGNNKSTILRCKSIYEKICKKIFVAETIKIAELSKLFENIQRDVNISLVNEMFKICDIYKINCQELLKICKTKWNFLDFKPGLVGGHCISVDPYYLIDNLKKKNKKLDLIPISRKINENFTNYILKKILNTISNNNSKKILFCGIGYKDNVTDIRNSKYLSLFEKLNSKKFNITLFREPNQILKKKYRQTSKLNFSKFDTIIFGSKNEKIENYINKEKLKFKNKLFINLFGKNLPTDNKEVKVINF